MLDTLVGAINNDTSTLSGSTGIDFPRHLTDEVPEYIVTGGRYFDFRGRDGLIKLLRQYVPENHYVVDIVKRQKHRVTLERLVALRNSPRTRVAWARKSPRRRSIPISAPRASGSSATTSSST
jgi:hypothetical protein